MDEGLLLLQEFELTDNTSDDFGASAIYGTHAPGAGISPWMEDLHIHDNEASGGGAIIELHYEDTWIRRAEFASNTAGDAIVHMYGGYDIQDTYFHHNTAHAGMRFSGGGTPTYLGRSTFSHNNCAFGTIKLEGGSWLALNNATFAFNDSMRGSVLSALAGSEAVATQLTVTDNSAILGAFHADLGASVYLEIVAAAGDVGNNLCAGGGAFTAWGSNAFSGDATCPMHPTDVMVPNLMVQPLADNGGFAPTMKPAPGSPLIDGSWQFWATWDQRNLPRGNGPSWEIGAFECQPGEC
ncbi:MAG: choice-of-anchor Q domain-containing protein [Myxococcota bacterium]